MRKAILSLTVLAITTGSSAFAQCPNTAIGAGNSCAAQVANVSKSRFTGLVAAGQAGGNVDGFWYFQGKGSVNLAAGLDNGNVPGRDVTVPRRWLFETAAGTCNGAGFYAVNQTALSNGGTPPNNYDCLQPLDTGTDRFVVDVESAANEGAVTHGGQFALASAVFDPAGPRFNLDNVTNGAVQNCCALGARNNRMAVTPIPFIASAADINIRLNDPVAGTATVYYSLPITGLNRRGYFDVDPGVDIIIGYLPYSNVSAVEPTTSKGKGVTWIEAPGGARSFTTCVGSRCPGNFQIPNPPGGQVVRLAFSLVFDANGGGVIDAPATDFVNVFVGQHSPPATILGPGDLPFGLTVVKQATQLGVRWSAGWSTTGEATITAMTLEISRSATFAGSCGSGINCTPITLTGGGGGASYQQGGPLETLKNTLGGPMPFYFRVRTDYAAGPSQYSNVVQMTGGGQIP